MHLGVKRGMWPALAALLFAPLPAAAVPAATASVEAGAPAGERPALPRPAIWLLADDDTRIYLFGTIHMLPPGLKWRSVALDRVVAAADELVLEVAEDPNDADFLEMAPFVMLPKPVPILSRVTPDRRKPLSELIAAAGMPVEMFDGMQTWAAATTIAVGALAQQYAGKGASAEMLTGVEEALRADFVARRRPISGVETGPQQLGFLAGTSPRTQRRMLEEMVDDYRRIARDGAPDGSGDDDWLYGDAERVGAEMEQMPAEMFDVLITRRNRTWTDWLIERLERPGTVLFAVGAGHLAGRDSVQSMLEARGFRVIRHD